MKVDEVIRSGDEGSSRVHVKIVLSEENLSFQYCLWVIAACSKIKSKCASIVVHKVIFESET
jgi:hypothetical protein